MHRSSDTCDWDVSSTSLTSAVTLTHTDSHIQSQTDVSVIMEIPTTSAEALPQADDQVQDDLNSITMFGTTLPTSDGNCEGDVCVSLHQKDCASSDEDEDDSYSDGSDDGDNASEISEFSDFSEESWQPVQGPIAWVQEQMRRGQSPRKILEELVPSGTVIPDGLDPVMLWKIIINIVSEPPKRKKLKDINTLDDVLRLLNASKKIIVLTGAGVSVSCGIPDFRSRDGVYVRLAKDFPNLPDPQAMFDIHFFLNDPRPFFKFAREIYPGQFKPSPCHRFIRMLEEKGKLLRNYTQNIDTLEQVAGIQKVVQCHGSFATATCTVCGHKVDSDAIKENIFNQVIPHCPRCSPSDQSAVMKPDIVFFGESLPEHFHNQMAADKDECDLLIVIGSSLKVRPVALIPNSLPASIPQILINRERLHYLNFDVELLGNCDEIIGELCRRLGPGWEDLATAGPPVSEVLMSNLPTPPASPHSGESRDRWDEASNPAVSSSEAVILCSNNAHDLPCASKEHSDQSLLIETSEQAVTSAQTFNPHDDDIDDVQEVSTSQSEPNLTKVHKGHYHHHHHHHPHRQSLKVPYSSMTTTTDQTSSNLPSSDQASDVLCSSKEVKTLVSACHRKDVMYIPTEKSSLDHHGQQSHDRTKSHAHHQPSVHEQIRSPGFKHNCHSSPHHQIVSPSRSNHAHSSSPAMAESSKDSSSHHEISTVQSQQESQTLGKTVKKSPSCSTDSVTADIKERAVDEGCPKIKKPRLSIKGCQEEGVNKAAVEAIHDRDVGEGSTCDSLSQDGSLDTIRKMWRSRCRVSLAQRLTDAQVLFLPPSCYVFKGAEVFSGSESEDDDDSSEDDDDESSDEDDVDIDEDKLTDNVLTSPEKLDIGKGLNSSTLALPEVSLHQKVTLSSLSAGDCVEENITGLTVQNVSTTETGGCTVVDQEDILVQHNECTPSSDIPYPQNKLSDGSIQCPVSSTEDFNIEQTAQHSNSLHSLQDQRD